MPFDNDFFSGFEDLFSSQDNLFQTDVKTILGKNIVLNYLCKIEFEIKSLGYSSSANEIAKFYEECKKKGGIAQFFSNPVIKIILQEIQSKPTIRIYLKNRILDDIENEERKTLEYIYKNNEKIKDKQDKELNEFSKRKELKRKKINKIMKEHNCTQEEAEKIYEQQKLAKLHENLQTDLSKDFMNFLLPPSIQDELTKAFKDAQEKGVITKEDLPQPNKSSNNTEIILDDSESFDTQSDDTFWD